jgi:hypothetical protein
VREIDPDLPIRAGVEFNNLHPSLPVDPASTFVPVDVNPRSAV